MKKSVFIIVGFLVVITGAYTVLGSKDKDYTSESISQIATPVDAQGEEVESIDTLDQQTETIPNGLGYVDYTEQSLVESADSKKIVFFHAPWCSVCNFFEGEIEKEGVPVGVTILKVDYDSETDLKQQYGVSIQSTFVLLNKDGEVVRKWPFAQGLNGIQDLYNQI